MNNRGVVHLFLCEDCDSQDYHEGACVSVYTCPRYQGAARIIRLPWDESRWRQETPSQAGIDEWSDEDIERYLELG